MEEAAPSQIRRTPVDGYILALSWSPEHCRMRKNSPKNGLQCSGEYGDFGFILHGLWPEAKGPDYPQYCRTVGLISRKIVADNICMTPDVQLLQHEWAKHGSCMVRRPETYFSAASLLFNALEFPEMDRLSRAGDKVGGTPTNARKLAEAFAIVNDSVPAHAIRVKTNNKGWLEEVRICLDKKFLPRRCPAYNKGAADKAIVKIWRGA